MGTMEGVARLTDDTSPTLITGRNECIGPIWKPAFLRDGAPVGTTVPMPGTGWTLRSLRDGSMLSQILPPSTLQYVRLLAESQVRHFL